MSYKVEMNFLREFPFLLEKQSRVEFLAIAYTGDVIFNTYTELLYIVSIMPILKSKLNDVTGPKNQVLRLSWEIIEHVYSLHKLLEKSNDVFIKTSGYEEINTFFYDARKLRDKKVHMFTNLNNFAYKKNTELSTWNR